MIRLFYAPPGWGKTAAMVAIGGIENMYGENAAIALEEANTEVAELNAKGFNVTPPRSDHLVYCSDNMGMGIDVTSPDFGYRRSLVLYPDRLGIATDGFKPQYVYRGSTLLIDELPDYADCRAWKQFAKGMCRYWAKHRKHKINMYATCQEVDQVEKRIRQHAMITEVLSIDFAYNQFGEVVQTIWQFNNWDCYDYWAKGREPTPETYVYNGDIRETYDTYQGEEEFYIGLEETDFSCEYPKRTDITPQAIAELGKRIDLSTNSNKE